MIYIKKTTEVQEIYVPRTELDKEAYITSVKTYEDGYNEGLIDGKEQQKDNLLNLYVTKNGVYNRNDGYGIVTVDIETEECPPISLEKGNFTASENGEYVITPTEGFDGLESLNLRVDVPQEGGNCNLVGGNLNHPIGEDFPIFDASRYGYDGFEWLGVRSIYNNEWQRVRALVDAYNSTEQITIDQNGTYSNADYRGTSYIVKNFLWFTDIIPTEETDVELWVKPLATENYWAGFIGSQNNDDDPTTFQIRRIGLQNEFEFRFGDQIFEYPFEEGKWYRLRMNKWGVWVNGEQVREWEVNNYVSPDYALAINGIENPIWQNWDDFYRVNYAEYGYVYFHNLGTLLTPDYSNAIFLFNNGHKIQYGNNSGSIDVRYYSGSLGYNKIDVNVPQEGGNCDDAYNEGYNNGYNDGQANCGEGGDCVLEHLEVNENGYYEPQGEVYDYLIVRENSAFDTGVKLVENTTIEIFFNTGDYDGNIPTLIGCEDADWDNSTFAVRWFGGNLAVKIGTQEINIPMGAEDETMKFHKLKFGRYEGVWLDDNYIEPFYDTEWILTQNTIYIGAMHNTTNGDANGVWRPWNGYIGNVKIYGEKNGEVRDFTFTCGDFGRWGEYWAEGDVLPNLMGEGGATLSCCKQYGDAPFDGYRSVSVNVDVETYKEEGRQEILNNLKPINITENGHYDIYELINVKYLNFGQDNNVWFSTDKNITKDSEIELAFMCANENHSENTLIATPNGFKVTFSGGGLRGIIGDKNTYNIGYNSAPFAVNYVKVNKDGLSCNENFIGWDANDWGENLWNNLTENVELFVGTDTNNTEYNFKNGILWVKIDGVLYEANENLNFVADDGSTFVKGGNGEPTFNYADVNKYDGSGWREINVNVECFCPSVQEEALKYDTIAFTYKVDGWFKHNLNKDRMISSCVDLPPTPLDCLLLRNRKGECTVMTKLDICSGFIDLMSGWNGDSIIYSLKANTIDKFSSNSINSYHLKSIETGFAQLEENAIMNCNKLVDIKVLILFNDLTRQFATNCFNGLPAEGTITIGKNVEVTLTDDEITSFFRTIVGEGWTIIIE